MKYICFFIIGLFLMRFSSANNEIDLSGKWFVALDSTDVGIANQWYNRKFIETISLPGTTDEAGMGVPNALIPILDKPQLLHLARKNSYVGPAWYSKEISIPSSWEDKIIRLKLERVLWESRVWVDGKELEGAQESLISPHYYDLTSLLKPGKHTISLRIDNRKKHDISVRDMAHAYTNETQIMWNGVIGDIKLEALDKVYIENVQVYPDVENKKIKVVIRSNNLSGMDVASTVKLETALKDGSVKIKTLSKKQSVQKGSSMMILDYPMGKDIRLWDEFNPAVYSLKVNLSSNQFASEKIVDFGMRNISGHNAILLLNGHRIFLRGTLECCIFPLTGHPPMDKAGWQKLFGVAKSWGLNHLRFHSWCPPQAAFEVADEMGFYLQIELPLWSLSVGSDKATDLFIENEAQRIIAEYGNHPSFCLWSLGNELQGDFNVLQKLLVKLKTEDPRHLYMTTTFTFEKGHGSWPEKDDDFFVTQWTKNGWVRGQGVFNSEAPRFDKDYSQSLQGITVPVITHEIGQYAVYPDLKEIERYTGVLDPLNFKAVQKDLSSKGLIDKADSYLNASGKLAVILYKEEIERALKTPGISGFQLLDLHDFPGQGTALVGLLNAFWESKGLCTPQEFSHFCAPVVPLIRYPKAVYLNQEVFEAGVEIANFSQLDLRGKKLNWEIRKNDGQQIGKGEIILSESSLSGNISCSLKDIKIASELIVKVGINGTSYENQWNIWVYPEIEEKEDDQILVTTSFVEAQKGLLQGRSVLFNPDWKQIKGIEGKFVPVFWSPVHFPKQAATMGVLCNPSHPALAGFPTEMYANWQWWDLCKNSKTMILDSISAVTPIVEMVDNFVNNRHLANTFEAKVGNGKLLFTSIDLTNDMKDRPVARQLRYSLLKYMHGMDFNPVHQISSEQVQSLLLNSSTDQHEKPEGIYGN